MSENTQEIILELTPEQRCKALMSLLEDVDASRQALGKKTEKLRKAKRELEAFSGDLEAKVKQRTFELSILYEVSNAISYTLDYRQLLKLIMESLFKIVDYDISASLLFDSHTANITLKPAYPQSDRFVDVVKNSLINSTSILTNENIGEKKISFFSIPSDISVKPENERQFDKLRSFFNVPFVVGGKIIGMINVSSCKESAFTENDIKLIYTIANQATSAIERLRAVITAEKSKMESMVESMVEGVIMIDGRGEIVVLNPQARQMLGLGIDREITGGVLNEKMDVISLSPALTECQKEKKLITKEIVIPYQEKNLTLHCDITPVKDTEGEVIGIVTILRDISREREIDQMKTEFISTVSHELRTPLAIIKEALSLTLDEIPGKIVTKQRDVLGTAKNNVDRLARIINSLLDISKIEAGKLELQKSPVNIENLIKNTVSDFRYLADEKQISLVYKVSRDKIPVLCDLDKIREVLVNLISNAFKFTDSGGRVKVFCENIKDEVIVCVQDSGIGIPQEVIPRLFNKFTQFGRKAGPGDKGTGLGLAISKGIIQMHEGRIWAESEVGRGSKFCFALPRLDF